MQFVSLHSVIILKYRYKKHKNTDKSLYTILPLPLLAFIRIKTGTNKKKGSLPFGFKKAGSLRFVVY